MRSMIGLGLGAFLLLSAIILVPGSTLAAPTEQTLWPDSTIVSQPLLYAPEDPDMAPWEAVYSGVPFGTGAGADTNGEYLFWGNATSASNGLFGVGVLQVGLSDPIGELAEYYNISLKAAGILMWGSHFRR